MAVNNIPDGHRLVRHVPKRALERDPDDDQLVIGVLGNAFTLRKDEDALSAAESEFYVDVEHSIQPYAAANHFPTFMTVKKNDRFVVGGVEAIKAACAEFGLSLRVVTDPVPGHDAHASVRRYRDDSQELLDLLAAEAWCEIISLAPAGS